MAYVLDQLRENAALIIIFLLAVCSWYLSKISFNIKYMRDMRRDERTERINRLMDYFREK